MVHEEDAVPLAGEGQKKLREFPLLPGPKPRPRLVQKEDLRPRGEEPGKLQKALLPRREPVRPLPSKLPQAHPPEGPRAVARALASSLRWRPKRTCKNPARVRA